MAEADAHGHGGETRRDFILLLGNAMAARVKTLVETTREPEADA